MNTEIKVALITVAVAVLIVTFAPFAIIWALNTLFALGIAYTFWTWLATLVLSFTWFSNHKTVSPFKK